MRKSFLTLASLLAAGFCPLLSAASICPSTVNTNSDCGYIITINPNGSITGANVTGANPYDGGDDALVGVVNNSPTTFSGTINLSGTGNGGGLFAFDLDGICSFTSTNAVSLAYCAIGHASDPADYQGPLNTFANINAAQTSGSVVFSGLAPGATTFFSLESSPASINGGGGIVVSGNMPEPATMVLLGSGFVGCYFLRRKRLV